MDLNGEKRMKVWKSVENQTGRATRLEQGNAMVTAVAGGREQAAYKYGVQRERRGVEHPPKLGQF